MIDRRTLARTVLPAAFLAFFAAFYCASYAAQGRNDNTLRKFNESVDALIKKVSPSVVQILVTGYGPIESSERGSTAAVIGRQRALRSGFLVATTGAPGSTAPPVARTPRPPATLPP